jgi:hypothetical protein
MANEINIQAILTAQRFSPGMQGSGNLNINQTNNGCVSNVQGLSTSYAALKFADMTSLGYLFVKNLDQTNSVKLSLENGTTKEFALLRPNEFCLVPVAQDNFWGKTTAGTASVLVVATQT